MAATDFEPFSAETLRRVAEPLRRIFAPVAIGLEHVPREGAVLLAGNHTLYGLIDIPMPGATFFGVIGLYPNLFPSSLEPAASLTLRNASSSPLTLNIMLVVAIIFVPLVIAYQSWVYFFFSDKVTEADLLEEEAY